MLRNGLMILFAGILLSMLAVTTYASLDRSILKAGSQLTSDPWFHATLADAYFGFITFYVWVAYQQKNTIARILWFVAIMLLGNIAMAFYVLLQLYRADPSASLAQILLSTEDRTASAAAAVRSTPAGH